MGSRGLRGRRATGRGDWGSAMALAGFVATALIIAVALRGARGAALVRFIQSGPPATWGRESTPSRVTDPDPDPTAVGEAAAWPPAIAAIKTYPDKMRSLFPDSTQLIVITGTHLGSNSGQLRLFNREHGRWRQLLVTEANFGRTGLVDGATRVSGHLNTPTGMWRIGGFVFGQHPQAPIGTKMPYRAITKNSWWSAARDRTYNTWVESRSRVAGEHLLDARVQYEYAFDTGYNSPPNKSILGRGTAIFVHCFEPPGNALGVYTHGCIAISPAAMLRLVALLDPARHPACAVGTEVQGTKTSIYSY